jgi:hypothetical protein
MLVMMLNKAMSVWLAERRKIPIHAGSRSLAYDKATSDDGPGSVLWELALKVRAGYIEAKQAVYTGILAGLMPFLLAKFGGGWDNIAICGYSALEKKIFETEWSPKRQQLITKLPAAQTYLDAQSPGRSLSIEAAWFIVAPSLAAMGCPVLHELCRYRSGYRSVAESSEGVVQALLSFPTMRILYSSMILAARKENDLEASLDSLRLTNLDYVQHPSSGATPYLDGTVLAVQFSMLQQVDVHSRHLCSLY